MANTDILVSGQIIDVRDTSTPRLAAHIRHAITCPSRYSHRIREMNIMLHEGIQYPTGEDPSHASSLKNQTCCFQIQFHNTLSAFKILKIIIFCSQYRQFSYILSSKKAVFILIIYKFTRFIQFCLQRYVFFGK